MQNDIGMALSSIKLNQWMVTIKIPMLFVIPLNTITSKTGN